VIGTFVGHKGAVWSAHLNATASQVVTGSADYTSKVWDSITGEEIHSWTHTRIVKSAQFSNDGKRILTGGQDKILRVFDLTKPDTDPLKLEGHTETIKIALWCKQENIIVSGGQDQELRVWDVRQNNQIKHFGLKNAITSIEVSLDQKHLVTTAGNEVTFWNAETFEVVQKHSLPIELNSASLSSDGNWFVAGGSDFSVRVYDFSTAKEHEIHKGHHGPVHCLHYAPDGATFASGSEDGTIRIWLNGEPRSYGLWYENKENKEPKEPKEPNPKTDVE